MNDIHPITIQCKTTKQEITSLDFASAYSYIIPLDKYDLMYYDETIILEQNDNPNWKQDLM